MGQTVEIKIDAFPFTRFGTLHARVAKVANDAIDEQDAKRAQSNAIASANSASYAPTTGPGQVQTFVFPVSLALDSKSMQVDGVGVPLNPA